MQDTHCCKETEEKKMWFYKKTLPTPMPTPSMTPKPKVIPFAMPSILVTEPLNDWVDTTAAVPLLVADAVPAVTVFVGAETPFRDAATLNGELPLES